MRRISCGVQSTSDLSSINRAIQMHVELREGDGDAGFAEGVADRAMQLMSGLKEILHVHPGVKRELEAAAAEAKEQRPHRRVVERVLVVPADPNQDPFRLACL